MEQNIQDPLIPNYQQQDAELIYLYIEKYNDFICNQELVLSNNFDIKLQGKKLTVCKRHNYVKNFYGEKINNISVLVGKNGSGKTTILDLFGMERTNRIKKSFYGNTIKDSYLLLYYLGKDTTGTDLYGIEVTGYNILKNVITNCVSSVNDNESYDKSKISIGKIYKYENDTFISISRHFFDYKINGINLSEAIRYAYIDESYRYSMRNSILGKRYNGDYMAERSLFPTPTVYQKYLMLEKCINGKINGLTCEKAIVRFRDHIDYFYGTDRANFGKAKELINEISKNLYLSNDNWITRRKKSTPTKKQQKNNYILDLCSRYILDMIINALYNPYKSNTHLKQNTSKLISPNDTAILDYVISLKPCDSSEKELGSSTNYEIELTNIIWISKKLKNLYKKNKFEYLKILARYVCSRLHSEEEQSEFKYWEAIEAIIDILIDIPEEHFFNEYIEFVVDGNKNLLLENLLKTYSYYLSESTNEIYSDIGTKLTINFDLLSEGEERFIDIIAKINDSINLNKNFKLLVLLLDEPDQSLHPEWSRRFIDILTQIIESLEFEGKIQLILSTHSPYLLSDILPYNVFRFDRNNPNRTLNISTNTKSTCFGANIYDLLNQDFFMNNTVGEFATKKINSYIKRINDITEKSDDLSEIEYFIEQIGEPLIKNAMKKRLDEKKHKTYTEKEISDLLSLITNPQDKEQVKAYLKNVRIKNDTYSN